MLGGLELTSVIGRLRSLAGFAGASLIGFLQAGLGAIAESLQSRERWVVNLTDFMSDTDRSLLRAGGVTGNVSAAFTSAEAALGANGGTIMLPAGIFLADNYNPTKHNVTLQGAGREATIIRARVAGAGTTVGVITLNNVSRGAIRDLSLDGNALKSYCLGLCPTNAGANAGQWLFENVTMYGATNDTVVLGNSVNNPDVSSITFVNCAAQGGAFGSAVPANSQVRVDGSNTLLNRWFGGVISGAAMPINIKISGGDFTCYGVQSANSTSYHCEAAGGQFRSYDEHSEGTGGFLHTLNTDPGTVASAQHMIVGAQLSNTGANSGGREVYHEAPRQLAIVSSFFSANVELNNANGRICEHGLTFAAGKGMVNQGAGGQIFGMESDGGSLLAYGKALRSVGNGTVSAQGVNIDIAGYQELAVSSAGDVNGPNRQGMSLIIRNTTVGGVALVTYQGNSTPVITSQIGAIFVTAAPAAGEIQIKTRGIGLGVSFLAGATRNNDVLAISYLACT